MKPSRQPPHKPLSDLWIYLLLAAAVLAVYVQVGGFGFVNYDDPSYVIGNPHVRDGITWQGMVWAFTQSFAGNWFPLTWLSHMLDCQIFGLDAGAQHLVNVVFHLAATLLLFAVLRRITGARGPSALVAALFALHPLHVESVAWIAERKDVLSAFLWMATLAAWARYVARPDGVRYAATLAVFCLALLAKPMVVTLPLVLLLLDYWPFARGVRIGEKLPFLALSAIVSAVTYLAHSSAHAIVALPLGTRAANALVSAVLYLAKTFWPSGLAVFYPYPTASLALPAAGCALLLGAITAAVVWQGRRRPYLAVGWLWFLITLAPVIGLVQAGQQARADRYMYLPMIGISIALVWGAAELLASRPKVRTYLTVAVCVVLAILTWRQAGFWRNSVALFGHTVAVTGDNYIARFNLAQAYHAEGDGSAAIRELREAVRIRPDSTAARSELAGLLETQEQTPDSLADLRAAVARDPDNASLHYRLGLRLGNAGRAAESAAELSASLRLDPHNADAHRNLGVALAMLDRLPEAVEEFRAALRLRPDDAQARRNLDAALEQLRAGGK